VWQRQKQLLRNRSLLRLLAGFGVVNVAEWGFMTALSVHAFDHGGALAVGLIGLRLMAGAISAAIIAPRVEDRPGVLTAIAVGRTVLLGTAALLAVAALPFGTVLALVIVDSVLAAGYRPAQQRLLPALAHSPSELTSAVASLSIAKTLGQAVGASCGGLAITLVAPSTVMLIAAAVMLISIPCCLNLRRSRRAARAHDHGTLRARLLAFQHIFGDPTSWPLVTAGVLRTLIRGLWSSLMVVVALETIVVGRSGVGLFQAAAGVGAVLAITITESQIGRPRLAPPCVVAFTCAGLAISAIGLTPPLAVALAVICAWGTAMAVSDAASMSLLHRMLDAHDLSRTIGVMESLKLLSEGAGALLAPALVALFGVGPAVAIAGAPLPLLMLITVTRINRADRRATGRSHLVRLVHGVDVFRALDMASIEDLASRLVPAHADSGQDVITQGGHGDRFYLIDRGAAEVLIDGYAIGKLEPGKGFGERALLRDHPRSATVRAETEMELYAIDRADFLNVLLGDESDTAFGEDFAPATSDPAALPLVELLAGLTPLHGLPAAAIATLAAECGHIEIAADELIFSSGDDSDVMYVILSGRAAAEIGGERVSVMHPGDVFGEIGILHATQRTATVRATEHLTLVTVPGEALMRARADADPAPA
jgi:CRP-like cAMP-binding protein